jgi:hypothetical protein
MVIKEVVKLGIVLYVMVRRRGKVPAGLRWSSCLVVLISPVH